jgi:uncharacterized protein
MKFVIRISFSFAFFVCANASAQPDSIVLKDLNWQSTAPAGSTELFIPSGNLLLAGLIYRANGLQKHPTLLLLHGYPGNERNLDIAQVVRARGWNVIYFDYRGSWGSQGKFSFSNCVEDVANVVAFCNRYQDSLRIDTSRIVLFGHSMGGWVCLKALEKLPQIKKGFALSTWDIYADFKHAKTEKQMLAMAAVPNAEGRYFVLNATLPEIFAPVAKQPGYFDLANSLAKLSSRQIVMLDEHHGNQQLAEQIKKSNRSYFDYEVWQTDHAFTNKRISLINKLLRFLDQ